MGSVSSVNPGLTSLLQTLSNVNSPVLSSPAVVSALEAAPAADIVQLSDAATQLEGMDELFGISSGSASSSGADLSSILANLEAQPPSSAGSASSASGPAAALTPADQLADYQAAQQGADTAALLGAASTGGALNVTG
jgi:hypothetical protein